MRLITLFAGQPAAPAKLAKPAVVGLDSLKATDLPRVNAYERELTLCIQLSAQPNTPFTGRFGYRVV